jgi:hypothetical protein
MSLSTAGENIADVNIDTQLVAIGRAPGNDERRRNARYNCVGVAEILRIQKATGEFVTGKIRNLSLGGCSIETKSPLERGSQLAVMLQVKTLRVRVIAEIRSVETHGQFSAGLEFVGMTAPGVQSLQALIAELNEKP